MPSPESIRIDDRALKQFAEGRFNSRTESKIAVAIEQSPELQERLAAISSDGMLDRVREIASKIQASDKDSPGAESPQASDAPKPSTGGNRRIKGVPKELAESGDYRILKELGRGGMGVVYLAKYLPMDRPEVLKVLNSQMVKRESARRRFVTEMKAIGKLNHPSIATAYQQVPLPTQLVFSMEYVPGIDLHKFIAKYQPIPIPAACEIASQIAGALHHAHKRKMVHRDIKPSNVMVFKEDDQRQIKILDFGLAKATSEQESAGLTADGTMLGTPEYMAPEQALDAATADIRADIYSLGCTLYHMLTGHPPFTGTYQSVLMSHATKDADYISFERTDVPVELSEIVAKMMGKEPDKRYQTPNEVVAALKPFCGAAQVTKTARPTAAKVDTRIDLGSPSRDTSIEGLSDLPSKPIPVEAVSQRAPHVASKAAVSVEESLASLKVQPRTARKPSQGKPRIRKGNSRKKKTPRALLVAGGLFAALLVWASVMMLKTDKGTLVIENIPENAQVLVDQKQVDVEIDGKTMTAKMVLVEGEYQVQVTVDGSVLQGRTVSVRSGSETNLIFRREKPSSEIATADTEPDATDSQGAWRPIFNANDFSGWQRDPKLWEVIDGVVIGKRGQQASPSPTYLVSDTVHRNFEAKFKIKLVGDTADSGFLFRSILTDTKALLVSGPQYSFQQGDWTTLWMQGSSKGGFKTGLLKDANESLVRSLLIPNEFNSVYVSCRDKDVVVALNGTKIIEGKFQTIPSAGLLAWQLWKGSNFEVHIKEAYIKEDKRVFDTDSPRRASSISADMTPHDLLTSKDYEWSEPSYLGGFPYHARDLDRELGDFLLAQYSAVSKAKNAPPSLCLLKRNSGDSQWRSVERLNISSTKWDWNPSLSRDGLHLAFQSNRAGGKSPHSDIWFSRRETLDSPWSKPAINFRGSTKNRDESPCFAENGLAVYFNSARFKGKEGTSLVVTRRPHLTARWLPAEELGPKFNVGLNCTAPVLSEDDRVLIFATRGNQKSGERRSLWMSTREEIGSPWSQPSRLDDKLSLDGQVMPRMISPDGQTLVMKYVPQGAKDPAKVGTWVTHRVKRSR